MSNAVPSIGQIIIFLHTVEALLLRYIDFNPSMDK